MPDLRIATHTFSIYTSRDEWQGTISADDVFVVLRFNKMHTDSIVLMSDGSVLFVSRREIERYSCPILE